MTRILITDLDGTLLGGTLSGRRHLSAELARRDITVVFATGRGVASVARVLSDPLVPRPRWIIADVGATVVGADLRPVADIQDRLRAGWPGTQRVRHALRRFRHLTYQRVPQAGRCSYLLAPEQLTDELTAAVAALGCGWQYSADRYFDVLPRNASKGNAAAALATKFGWPTDSILVAGDSRNDASLFDLGAHGVIVGGAEPALHEAVPDDPRVLRPDRRGAGAILEALRDLGWIAPDDRYSLVVGYHRPPVNHDARREFASPNGILPTLTALFDRGLPGVWVAAAVDTPAPDAPISLLPVTGDEWCGYFHRACKDTLWPILMSAPHRMRFDVAAWTSYREFNRRYAEHIAARTTPDAIVWLHDYNLWLVPGLLRRIRPDLRIGLFHHTPFPPPEVFAALPTADEICCSLRDLDWAGFHTADFADNFRRTLGDQSALPALGVHPLGIDRPAIEALARRHARHIRPGRHDLVLSVERLDYAKAPVPKVDAFEAVLAHHPRLRRRLVFRLICPPPEPGITAHDATRIELERRIVEVNDTWRTDDWLPIDYVPRTLPLAELIEHYLTADVFWVTSLQDGMNLTAKEFIAAQSAVTTGRAPGVLVLSRHAGAAIELGAAALLTDPESPADLTTTLVRALSLTPTERRTRAKHLAELLGHDHPIDWATGIIDAIRSRPPAAPKPPYPS
ncbi:MULTISPECIES: trehalose-6-phosphate synthase [unclassified Nocardia]|uniref:trehalose-6-phosphate synthase n=1 Tax=unclassified Nocardia TaxID=2637762 RepID=UPI001CE4A3F0|nr:MULTISPECIES: trehalose-6-phosphate synthase [unclassified Nocardia]